MAQTFFFYDLETSGLNARDSRIMQFAGIRTDTDFNPIGEPYNVLVALNDDTLPSPEALLVTGITPQQTVTDGYTEAQFARLLTDEVFTDDTVAIGFNNIRFDDEFVRHLFWRTFNDPYEWCWKNGRGRWDLLDVVRMVRALRPDGIVWPEIDGKASNKLELLTKVNGIDHLKAHDALSDVEALIAVTKLIRDKQPQMYKYLFSVRDKKAVKSLVNLDDKKPFVYTSGRYDAEHAKTTVAFPLTSGKNGNVIVYDLRYDPSAVVDLSPDELKKKLNASWEERNADGFVKVPVKELQYNRAPAVAPLGVLEQAGAWERIHLDAATIEKHRDALLRAPHFAENIRSLFENRADFPKSKDVEVQLYDGFVGDRDKLRIETVRNATERELTDFHPEFSDERLSPLLLHYKARNFPRTLTQSESVEWEQWRTQRIANQLPAFMKSFEKLSAGETDEGKLFIFEEMKLWLESIAPADTSNQDSMD
ncbi:exodeoxyribonuclease I [Candidatus Saccharibacteria bacterium RIFCSPHIGHO2_01_FULL_45_15]|nr:MAG: exodeoxyribonuclease I [Candidatus Saccharibacteria bacterium RIFCSPHIGHO2_01_FULL_45_15]OGL28765.1 MAG: exodeoxyribonuclease I [Candidatus Saccharibacteria bacterium RIFCSPHIGHO2_02_FULL_46_12]OGL31799.1 MAG: exodeoxyribonuclease I [Candidatus Saccharibacteria bacterium RIFCSPHIGHO2_12_FULL_44_22]